MLQARRESPKAVDKFLKLALVLDNSMVSDLSYTVQSIYNRPRYNTALDMIMLWLPNLFTM